MKWEGMASGQKQGNNREWISVLWNENAIDCILINLVLSLEAFTGHIAGLSYLEHVII